MNRETETAEVFPEHWGVMQGTVEYIFIAIWTRNYLKYTVFVALYFMYTQSLEEVLNIC